MTKKNIHTLIKKIVEEGKSHTFTLLYIQTNEKQRLTLQNAMEQTILVEHKVCGHKYKILFSDFLQSKKVCKVCASEVITGLLDQRASINYSQHNTQAK